jgi:hypothetical protein
MLASSVACQARAGGDCRFAQTRKGEIAMNEESPGVKNTMTGLLRSGALGVGVVLVAMPTLLLFLGARQLQKVQMVGLPLLAIFGIMILFGSLALVAMLFESLGLTDPRQPLALPEGSIRAAIALSLIVLFAIISIMLFQSAPGTPFEVKGLNETQRNELLSKASDRVVATVDAPCAASVAAGAACPDADRRYIVSLRPGVPNEITDLAKQLLILVGTLMTSVTSYYFAARSVTTTARKDDGSDYAGKPPVADAPLPAPSPDPAATHAEAHVDGCDVAITNPTPDAALPPARGGVATTTPTSS